MENTPPPSSPAPLPNNPSPTLSSAERNWCMWCHMSALAGLVVPMGNILGPLIIWQMKRAEFPAVDEHGKEALNFQLSVLIYLLAGGMVMFFSLLICVGWLLLPVLVPALCLIPVAGFVLTIIAGIKGGDGVLYRYPLTLRLVK
jgi:uncharacterized Tic20 family protein